MEKKVIFSLLAVLLLFVSSVDAQNNDKFSKDILEKKPDNPKLEQELGDQIRSELAIKGSSADLKDNLLQVIIELNSSDPRYIAALEKEGAVIEASDKNLIQARVQASMLKALSDFTFVNNIHRPERIRHSVTSEGAAVINASRLHSMGINGSGVKIAVLDLGFKDYALKLGNELPADVIVRSFRKSDGDITGGGEVHGTAVAETVHDIAPGARLYLVNIATDLEINNAVKWLIDQHVDIISFSAGKLIGPKDGTDYIDGVVNNATAAGILWVNAAGNEAREHWSGNFYDPDGNGFQNFALNDETQDIYAGAGSSIEVLLDWNDWPYSNQDYDLYLLNGSLGKVAASENWQTGTQPPVEEISYNATYTGYYKIAIKKYNATRNVKFHLYSPGNPTIQYIVPSGSILIPATSNGSFTAGATYWANDNLESFSSQGPTDDGRIKPDAVAPDGTSNSVYGNFYGTSASTPHVSGAAALLLQIHPGLGVNRLKQALESGAKDLGATGKDNQYGAGRIDVYRSAQPFLAENITMSIGNGSLKIGQDITLPVGISNASSVAGGSVKILFDPLVVNAISAASGDFGADNITIDNSTGSVSISNAGEIAIGKDEAVLANITFRGMSEGITSLNLTEAVLNLQDGGTVIPVTRDGLLNISSVRGDVNLNGDLDTGDVTLILRYIVHLPIPLQHIPILPGGDMNCNGRIDTGDATLALREIVKLPMPRCWI